ncbi:hypothetical protein EFK50_17700 [Nocardioides marmoriginsengisoli]|uniref:Uncharacterized protein n=1 Tax=Nocardioides marmoriginsengisoli TaxID=661483 RepID=A0A3N0CCM8_9ACTN|nr:hypothetical protein [Nocardioides marmoriginsengisoli]RNL61204.1 hypothetical protein EFK50_17700 [Nocardioides marmoriginsengisoli]
METKEGSGGDDDPDFELIRPEDFLPPQPFPADARRMGVDRYTGGDGAFLAMAAALDGRKTSHRVFALVLLIFVITPVALSLWQLFR